MSAASDGARADARKRLAESRPTADVALAMFRRKYGREPVPESFDQSRLADCRETVALIWPEIAGVIADAKAEALREAAKEIAVDAKSVYYRDDSTFHASQRWALTDTAPDWLRDRAKRIEQESGR